MYTQYILINNILHCFHMQKHNLIYLLGKYVNSKTCFDLNMIIIYKNFIQLSHIFI